MGLIKTSDEIEYWYSEAVKALDEEFARSLTKNMQDDDAKAHYQQKLRLLKSAYELHYHRLHRWEDARSRFLDSKLVKNYLKTRTLWRRLRKIISRSTEEEEA